MPVPANHPKRTSAGRRQPGTHIGYKFAPARLSRCLFPVFQRGHVWTLKSGGSAGCGPIYWIVAARVGNTGRNTVQRLGKLQTRHQTRIGQDSHTPAFRAAVGQMSEAAKNDHPVPSMLERQRYAATIAKGDTLRKTTAAGGGGCVTGWCATPTLSAQVNDHLPGRYGRTETNSGAGCRISEARYPVKQDRSKMVHH